MKYKLILDETQEEEVCVTAHRRTGLTDQIEALVLQGGEDDQVWACLDDEWLLLRFSEIECVTVLDGKTYAIDRQGRHCRLKHRLYELEELLPDHFIRINKSTLANERRLERFVASFSGAVDAHFQCGYTEYVSRRCFAAIKRRFDHK